MLNRNQLITENFKKYVLSGELPEPSVTLMPDDVGLSGKELIDLFETMLMSRHLDLHSREMQKAGNSFYTIGSSGHEGNAVIAKAFKPDDMAFLHYRSGAFMIQRSKQVPGETPLYDMLLSFSASAEDPISGGRHKVLGSKTLSIPPQTSTIASHLPKAVGAAFSVPLHDRAPCEGELPSDSVVICNFGDASSNHSTAQGAFNTAAWTAYQSVPLPLVFICEDNGIGISTSTPTGWIAANYKDRAGLEYIYCDGLNMLDTWRAAKRAEYVARVLKKPVFLHMRTVRLLGHAGSDSEFAYRSLSSIEANEFQDPLLHAARLLISQELLTPEKIVAMYDDIAQRVERVAVEAVKRPRLTSAKDVMSSIVPPSRDSDNTVPVTAEKRQTLFAHEKHNVTKKQHLAKLINWALMDLMAERENVVVCGEDVGKKGGVYNVTSKLFDTFGGNRVINTLLDEQSILGLAIGLAHNGYLPIPEIQFLAYVHNAEDQIRGEAATLPFFSNGQFDNPMVIRIAGLAYQRGFGGHFHNDNSLAVFRDIPGIIIACPSNGEDAVEMLRSCVRMAQVERRVVVFIEPIALYMKKDLHEEGDGLWSFDYIKPEDSSPIEAGMPAVWGDGEDVCIVSYGNGYYLSRQAEKLLKEKGINVRLIDIRWLAPLNVDAIIDGIGQANKVLVVDECRETGSISEAIVTGLYEKMPEKPVIERITAEDCFIPLGTAAYTLLPSTEIIVDKVTEMMSDKVAVTSSSLNPEIA